MTDADFLYSEREFVRGIPEHIEIELEEKFSDVRHCDQKPRIHHVDDLVFSKKVRRIVTFVCKRCNRTFCESYILKKEGL